MRLMAKNKLIEKFRVVEQRQLAELRMQEQRPAALPGAVTDYNRWSHSADWLQVRVIPLWDSLRVPAVKRLVSTLENNAFWMTAKARKPRHATQVGNTTNTAALTPAANHHQ